MCWHPAGTNFRAFHSSEYMMMKNPLLFFLACLLFISSTLNAQEINQPKPRPKIGVVLSGGGAKGIAHIGVLKALEDAGIKPDYIAGTSMGSIIGGLYALGYNADQLDTIIRSINWDLVLSNNIPLNYISYEEKEYYNRFLLELPMEKGHLKLPSGLIQGQMLGEMLARYCWPAKDYDNFDEFPIPFRCVATDVSTGKAIVFKDGSLAKALRASMAIPSAFTAVDLDTTLAVDGGVVNNFPVEELFKMGADYIIGINVSHGFQSAYEIESMTGILLQIAMIPSSERLNHQIEQCDIYIMPELEGYSTASFSSYKEILAVGYTAGEKFKPRFQALSDSIGINLIPGPPVLLKPDSVIIGEIIITGNKLVTENLIRSKLQIKVGDKVPRSKIEEGVRSIYGVSSFNKVVYRLSPMADTNHYELTVKTIENSPVTLKGSVHYDNIFGIGIVMNLTMRNLLGKSSRTIVAGDISENPNFRFDYLKYLGHKQRIAFDFRYDFANEEIPFYEEGQLKDVEISRKNDFSGAFITTQSLRNSLLIGASYNMIRQKQKFSAILPAGVNYGNFNSAKAEAVFTANTFNDRNYPTSGREFTLTGQVFFHSQYSIVYDKGVDTVNFPITIEGITIPFPLSESDFNEFIVNPLIPSSYGQFQFSYYHFVPINDKFQFIPGLTGGLTLSNEADKLFLSYRIGGHQRVHLTDVRFFGYNYAEVDYANYAIGKLNFQNILLKKIYVKYGVHLLLPYDHVPLNDLDQFDFDTLINDNSVVGVGLEATYKSFLGPMSLGVSRNSRDRFFRYYLSIGFSFNYSD